MSQENKETLEINPEEGAIVFRKSGLDFHYPKDGAPELKDTFEFLMFAMLREDWMAEWYAHLDAAEALADLAGGKEDLPSPPMLTVIEGGKSDE